MKYIPYFFLILLSLSIVSCGDDETNTSDLDINVQLKYGAEDLVLFSDLEYPDGTIIEFSNFSFYISDLIVSDGSKDTMLTDVQFWDFDDSQLSAETAPDGKTFSFSNLELGDIQEISFNIGLTPDQNSTVPSDYSSGHPLGMSSEYWLNWESYIFTKIEGFYDTDDDGIPDSGFNLHLGSDAVLQTVNLTNLNSGSGEPLNLEIDLLSIFSDDTSTYDLLETPRIHSLAQINEAVFLSRNLKNSVKLSD